MADQPSRFLHSLNPSEVSMLNLQTADSLPASTVTMARQPKAAAKSAPNSTHAQGFGADEEEMNAELWHACAGPQHGLPPRGSVVAYFPQGHIEQVASFNNPDVEGYTPRYDLPAAVPCSLNDIQLSADPDTDEVFATCTLVPVTNPVDESARRRNSNVDAKPKSVSFTKILTVSDTSTHGGFSVPRRGAEDCFPPLDKTQDNPIQDLIAKDLHGTEWKFRHLFRGQPKRHLLTTGWSVFVSQKRLQAGDAVLFLRDVTGQLRIAVRLAPRQQKQPAIMVTSSMAIGVLEAAGHAVTEKNRFSLIYNPRSSPSQFIIPYTKYAESLKQSFAVGQRVKSEYGLSDVKSSTAAKPNPAAGHRSRARFEAEDSTDSRCTGTIVETADYDVAKWPGSAWRSIKVNWDEPSSEMQEKVSPWEIIPFTQAANAPPPDRSRKRYNKPAPQMPVAQPNSAISRNSGVNLGRQEAIPPFGNHPRTGLQDFLDMRGMEAIPQPESGVFGMQVFHPYRNQSDVGSLPLSPRLSKVTHYVKDEDDTDLRLRPPVGAGARREPPSWPAASMRFYPEPRSSPSINGPDCTVLSMGGNPAPESFISPPTPTLPMWESQSRRMVAPAASSAPSGSSDQHKCRLFGVELARPAALKVTTADLSSYSVSNEASEDSNAEMGTPLSALNLTPGLESPWQRPNDADWQLKLAPEQAHLRRNGEGSTFRGYGETVYDYKHMRFDR